MKNLWGRWFIPGSYFLVHFALGALLLWMLRMFMGHFYGGDASDYRHKMLGEAAFLLAGVVWGNIGWDHWKELRRIVQIYPSDPHRHVRFVAGMGPTVFLFVAVGLSVVGMGWRADGFDGGGHGPLLISVLAVLLVVVYAVAVRRVRGLPVVSAAPAVSASVAQPEAGVMQEQMNGKGARDQEGLWMGSWRLWAGGIVSVLWIVGVVWLVCGRWTQLTSMELNALGDFFAGVFAPLAFLWLVLGYLQQGDELRLSTNELSQSVIAQRDLARVSREQLNGERLFRAAEEAQRELSVRPLFRVMPGEIIRSPAPSQVFDLLNAGGGVTDLIVVLRGLQPMDTSLVNREALGCNERMSQLFVADLIEGKALKFEISFRNALGKMGSVVIDGLCVDDDRQGYVWTEQIELSPPVAPSA